MSVTDDPSDPRLTRGIDLQPTGQADVYLVLSEAERAKGFIRPVRDTYIHTGIRPANPLREITEDEKLRYGAAGYIAFEEYPKDEHAATGRYWTLAQLNSGCGTPTTMGRALSETYARDPKFYGSTYCVHCQK